MTDELIFRAWSESVSYGDALEPEKILKFAHAIELLSASKHAAPEELATMVRRMRKDESCGDTVFRCGFNGAIDAVLKLLAASPAAPAQSGEPVPYRAVSDCQYIGVSEEVRCAWADGWNQCAQFTKGSHDGY